MVIPSEVNIHENTTGLYSDVLDGKNIARVDTSEHAGTSPRCEDDADAMVEELTIRNFNSGNLETGGSNIQDKTHNSHNNWQLFHRRPEGPVSGVWEDPGSNFFPELVNTRESRWSDVYWELIEPVVKIRTLRARMIGVDRDDLSKVFIQLTLEFLSKHKFEAKDSKGVVVAGNRDMEVLVRDIRVFEKSQFHPGAYWRLCGRIPVKPNGYVPAYGRTFR